MIPNREAIYAALFAKVSAAAHFVTTSRRLRHWGDVKPGEQPALFQSQVNESASPKLGYPTKWTMNVRLYVYVQSPQNSPAPSSALNPLLDAVEAALAPDPVTNRQTLNGACYHCAINGTIETDEGTLGVQSVAIIPLTIEYV
jgi:hypothetical protein